MMCRPWPVAVQWMRQTAVLLTLIGLLLSGCAPAATAAPPPAASPTRRPTATLRPPPPSATPDRFVLRPSSTPLATDTPAFIPSATPFPPDMNPLTGLTVADPALLERRPMVIKVTNYPRSVRPQWGLSLADHVYEYYLEDELTRFIAVFYGQDVGRVGPVRSARPFDEYIFRMYRAIFAFGYADDRVIDLWKDSDWRNLLVIESPDNCPPMCRIGSETNYNTLYTDTDSLSRYVSARGVENGRQDLRGLYFEADNFMLRGAREVNRVEIRYSLSSYNYWQYDPATGRYLRWQDAERLPQSQEDYQPLTDSLTGQQLGADNLVVLLVPMTYFFLSNSTEIYDFQYTGKGKGFALRDGRIYAIEWRKRDKSAMVTLSFAGGGPFPLKPGNIWFEVLSDISTHQSNGPTWHFDFAVPERPTATPTKVKKRATPSP